MALTDTGQQLIGQANGEQIQAWKSKYRYGIFAIETEGHVAYFKNPDRHDLNCALSKSERERVLSVYEELASITFIGGSENILTDDQMFIGASQELKVKLEGKKARLVNL